MENIKEKKLIGIFQKAKFEPASNMAPFIWQTIITRDKRANQFKLWGFSFVGFASFAGLIPAINVLLNDLTKSGLYEYFSLIFAGGGSVFSYWKELILSLAESLPIMSITFTLSLVFVFFLSIRYIMKQIGENQLVTLTTLSI